jgi:hypothetical protein
MFNIHSHKGNANQIYTKIPSQPSQIGHRQEKEQQQMLVRVGQKKNPHTRQ